MSRDAKGRHFGHLKLVNCYGFKLVVSPDVFMWIMPTGITLALFIGGIYVAGTQPLTRWSAGPPPNFPKAKHFEREISWFGIFDLVITLFIVGCALVFSLLCGLTDPGAIPRVDPSTTPSHPGSAAGSDHQQNSTTTTVVEMDREMENRLRREDYVARAAAANNNNNNLSAIPIEIDAENAVCGDDNDEERARLLVRLEKTEHNNYQLGRVDPYADMTQWVHCRICNLRRPPRAAHCYTCGICTLQSDHHCGVVGGDVSLRSLRWFVLYLQCIGIGALNTLTWILGSLFDVRNRNNPGSMALHISLMVFVGNIVLMVGGLAVFYTWMVFSDLTRRESQGKKQQQAADSSSNHHVICYYHENLNSVWRDSSKSWFGNLKRVFNPPPSLIAWEE